MSCGPGKWEGTILDVPEKVPAFYLTDLLPTPHTRSQVVALNRAASDRFSKGKVETCRWLARYSRPDETPKDYITVYRLGYPAPTREQVVRLKYCTSSRSTPDATLNKGGRLRFAHRGGLHGWYTMTRRPRPKRDVPVERRNLAMSGEERRLLKQEFLERENCVVGTLNALTLLRPIERRERPANVRAERESRIRAVDEALTDGRVA